MMEINLPTEKRQIEILNLLDFNKDSILNLSGVGSSLKGEWSSILDISGSGELYEAVYFSVAAPYSLGLRITIDGEIVYEKEEDRNSRTTIGLLPAHKTVAYNTSSNSSVIQSQISDYAYGTLGSFIPDWLTQPLKFKNSLKIEGYNTSPTQPVRASYRLS